MDKCALDPNRTKPSLILSTLTKQTMGLMRRRTSTKQRSITLVVRSLRHKCRGKAKNDNKSGISSCSRRTIAEYVRPPARAEGAKGTTVRQKHRGNRR